MALILSLETSGKFCSVALHQDGRLIDSQKSPSAQDHATSLATLIKQTCAHSAIDISQINAVSVSSGPGSYTGLRIGASTAKGLCYALSIPLIAIPTLELLAHEARNQLKQAKGIYCPMIDARRMEVYCELFDESLNVLRPAEALIIDATSFGELLEGDLMFFFGDGADKCKEVLKHRSVRFVDGILPSAEIMGQQSFERFRKGQFEDLLTFVPFYLKDFIAKRAASPL